MLSGHSTSKPGFFGWGLALALTLLLLSGLALLAGTGVWAEDSARKVKTSVPPEYPELARRMNIRGTVRVEVTVAPDGTVKKVQEIGGNPVLVEALVHAVKKWKYEPAAKESVFEVKYEFVP